MARLKSSAFCAKIFHRQIFFPFHPPVSVVIAPVSVSPLILRADPKHQLIMVGATDSAERRTCSGTCSAEKHEIETIALQLRYTRMLDRLSGDKSLSDQLGKTTSLFDKLSENS